MAPAVGRAPRCMARSASLPIRPLAFLPHADPQHPHRSGPGGDVLRLDRGSAPVLYASTEDSGRSNRLILIGGAAWVALVLVNWGMSLLVV